jgi:hypothetical protein
MNDFAMDLLGLSGGGARPHAFTLRISALRGDSDPQPVCDPQATLQSQSPATATVIAAKGAFGSTTTVRLPVALPAAPTHTHAFACTCSRLPRCVLGPHLPGALRA